MRFHAISLIIIVSYALRPAFNIIENEFELLIFSVLFVGYAELGHAVKRFSDLESLSISTTDQRGIIFNPK